jgi:hypothetical protein
LAARKKKLALGSYPEVSLKDARAKRDEARKAAQAGSDPALAKREARIAQRVATANTFAAIAEEYIDKLRGRRARRSDGRENPVAVVEAFPVAGHAPDC